MAADFVCFSLFVYFFLSRHRGGPSLVHRFSNIQSLNLAHQLKPLRNPVERPRVNNALTITITQFNYQVIWGVL